MTTEYKQTSTGKIPKDWKVVRVDEILSLEYGKGLPERQRIPGKYPVVGSNGVVGYHDQALVNGPGIVVGRKGTIGAVSWIDSDFWPIDTTYYVKLKRNDVFLKWLFFELLYLNLKRFHLADVVPGLKRELVYFMRIPLPPIEEQRRIAEVLSGVDDAIRRVDLAIAKTERLKKGLMQKLLTEGIGHKEFKETKIGKTPKTWKIVRLEDVCNEITDGSHWSPKEVKESNYRIATVANLKENYIDINSCKFVSKEDYMRLLKEGDVPKRGDILFSKDGTVGISFTFKQDGHNIGVLSSIAIIRPKPNLLDPDFGAYVFKSPYVLPQVMGRKTGTALRRIILKHIRTIRIPLPTSLAEQKRIAEILSTIDYKLNLEKKRKEKLEHIKRGLMVDLLAGRRRVKVAYVY